MIKNLNDKKLSDYFDVLIGNPLALEKNERFIDYDLNRAYPGDPKSDKYELRRAAENLEVAKKYQYIIDIHKAGKGNNNFIIAPRPDLPTKFPLDWLSLDTVLLWPDPQGPLGGILDNCVELEFGIMGRDYQQVVTEATEVVENFILAMEKNQNHSPKEKTVYRVDGTISLTDWEKDRPLPENFQANTFQGEEFYPLLVNQYARLGILCYKMKKINK